MTVLIVLPHGSVAAVADYYESIKQDPVKLRQFLQQSPKAATYITTFLALYMRNRICSGPAKTASALI